MFEKIAEWNIVKYIGSLINPKVLGKQIDKIMNLYETNTLHQAAKRLFIWGIVIIIIGTMIDLAFYWMRPEQQYRIQKYISAAGRYKKILIEKAKNLSKNKR